MHASLVFNQDRCFCVMTLQIVPRWVGLDMFHKKRLLWALIFGLIAVFLKVLVELDKVSDTDSGLHQFDNEIIRAFVDARTPTLSGWAVDITALGSAIVLTGLVLFLVALFSFRRHWGDTFQIALAGFCSGMISPMLKVVVQRERPPLELRLVEVQHYSYPSGHAMASAIIFFTIGLIFYERYRHRAEKYLCLGAASFLVVLIGLSRIYLGVHYPSDVLGGFALGASVALIIFALRRLYQQKFHVSNHDVKS